MIVLWFIAENNPDPSYMVRKNISPFYLSKIKIINKYKKITNEYNKYYNEEKNIKLHNVW